MASGTARWLAFAAFGFATLTPTACATMGGHMMGGGTRNHDGRAACDSSGVVGRDGAHAARDRREHPDSAAVRARHSIRELMSAYQEVAAHSLSMMEADRIAQGLQADSGWIALADSVRQDLAELPGPSGERPGAGMRARTERMRRLMAMHQSTMNSGEPPPASMDRELPD